MSRYWQVEELAAYASGMTEEQYSEFLNDEGDFDELLHEKFEVDFNTFEKIAEALLLLTPKVKAGISGDTYHAFVKDSAMVLRQKVENSIKAEKE